MSEPTAEEIERVQAHLEAQRKTRFQESMIARQAKIDANVQQITTALTGETVAEVEIEEMRPDGEIAHIDGYVKLTFASGRTLKISVGGWDEIYLAVEIDG